MKKTKIPVHPLADAFPMLEGAAWDKLLADVKANGQRDPIELTPDGTLIDGRNRLRACETLGITPRFRVTHGDPKTIIISRNLRRRHMSRDQRIMLEAMHPEFGGPYTGLAREREMALQLIGTPYAAKVVAGKYGVRAGHNMAFPKPRPHRPPRKKPKHLVRVIIPDSHGEHIDRNAAQAFLDDLARLNPEEIVMLGDHLDCGGTFSTHQRAFTNELTESYADDVSAANWFLDEIQKAAPKASIHYIEGNHEQHVERWATREFAAQADAVMALEKLGPIGALRLNERGIAYYRRGEYYHGLSVPGTIKLGKCYFTHGVSHGKHADAAHREKFGANIVFGHVHRALSVIGRSVDRAAFGAWCPGTLAKLQPLWKHTAPTDWTHGYGLQFVNAKTGQFMHQNVPIYDGKSLLFDTIDILRNRRTI